MKILHIITALDKGGAETNLYRLTTNKINVYENYVISLKKNCYYEKKLIQNNIKVLSVNFKNIFLLPNNLYKIIKFIKIYRPSIINTWMYHSIFLSILIFPFINKKVVVNWYIRHSTFDYRYTKIRTLIIIYFSIIFSYLIPKKIVYNSLSGCKNHQKFKFSKKKSKIILNGFDSQEFTLQSETNYKFLDKYNLKNDTLVFGAIGRYRKQKNYENLVKLLGRYKKINKNFVCLFVGYGLNSQNKKIKTLIKKNEVQNNIYLFDQVENIVNIMNILDINLLFSNYGEGFPNVLAESMLCGTPCIAFDIGDSKSIIGSLGWIAKKNDNKTFLNHLVKASKIKNKKSNEWIELKKKCRDRIISNYKIQDMINKNIQLWKEQITT